MEGFQNLDEEKRLLLDMETLFDAVTNFKAELGPLIDYNDKTPEPNPELVTAYEEITKAVTTMQQLNKNVSDA